MFQGIQRLKGAIDTRIAEEQARHRANQSSPSRSGSNVRRSNSRAVSPSKRAGKGRDPGKRDGEPLTKDSDPSEYESVLGIDDEFLQSRAATPRPAQDGEGDIKSRSGQAAQESTEDGASIPEKSREEGQQIESPQLPEDVAVKLRKLDKLASRYRELLHSYRLAHERVLSIEPFENTLRENTPLTSISDPGALVEYLNQVNLKGDMVLDELKRVSNERDALKQKLDEAENKAKETWDEISDLRAYKNASRSPDELLDKSNDISIAQNVLETSELSGGLSSNPKSPTASIRSRTASIPSLSLFSPKPKAAEAPSIEETEDFFSYENEIPKLQNEREHAQGINRLQEEIKFLKSELEVAQESAQSMVQSLEAATRDLNMLKEKDEMGSSALQDERSSFEQIVDDLRTQLDNAQLRLQEAENQHHSCEQGAVHELEKRLEAANAELHILRSNQEQNVKDTIEIKALRSAIDERQAEISRLRSSTSESEKKISTLTGLVSHLRAQLAEVEEGKRMITAEFDRVSRKEEENQPQSEEPRTASQKVTSEVANADEGRKQSELRDLQPIITDAIVEPDVATAGKRKNKKKKKGGKAAVLQGKEPTMENSVIEQSRRGGFTSSEDPSSVITLLKNELNNLRQELNEKDIAIERMNSTLKNQDDLREEIENLRDDLIHVGQEHVTAKDQMKELLLEREALKETVVDLEKEITSLRDTHASNTVGTEQAQKDLTAQFEDLKQKTFTLQTDLYATQQLAASRFQDLTDLRTVMQKAQPELSSLRKETAELKSIKEELDKTNSKLRALEADNQDALTEIRELQSLIAERDRENKTLNQKIGRETKIRLKAEESLDGLNEKFQRSDSEKQKISDSLDKVAKDLLRSQEEVSSSNNKIRDLEQRFNALHGEIEGLKEETELKTAQYASAQSLMSSMRDQTSEMAMQLKESQERREGFEEEVTDTHRLLSERTREGETMRRLLADVETRADSRIREMKERMDMAIEERDRAEDEASTAGRRKARELEELRSKVRDVERDLKRVEDDKEELENAQQDWKRRREELERTAKQTAQEAEELRRAMSELRDTLDENESQTRNLEKEKEDLRRSIEETEQRIEKLQKSNKAMVDEIRAVQAAKSKGNDSEAQSSRSSLDSARSKARPSLSVPKSRTLSSAMGEAANGQAPGSMDFVYLKNVLLQFLEQKDKKHQMQLVPVLGMLLHFDRKDEQKWMAAITTK